MRTTGAVLLAIGILFVGMLGMSVASDTVEEEAMNNSDQTTDMYNVTDDITEGASGTVVQVITWGGFAAIVLGAIGLLVYLSPGGR